MRLIGGFIASLIVLAIIAVAVGYSGIVSFAAGGKDPQWFVWLVHGAFQRSVRMHADTPTQPQLGDAQAMAGFKIYNGTCVYCHGGPGKDPGDIGQGLNPEPPFLPDTVAQYTPAELFYIIKNGARMTGMASYGASYKDPEIWSLVAFVQRLPKMTEQQYADMEKAAK